MLTFLSAIFGFAAPFLPELLKYFRAAQDNAHELALLRLRMEQGAVEHLWKMEEINARADIEEAKELHKPAPSFGVQLLDAAEKWAEQRWGKWLILPAFYAFVILDFVAGMVRPSITYAAFAFYTLYKWALFSNAKAIGQDNLHALMSTWGEQDWAVLTLVLSYWFGHRAAKAAFGGSASTAYRGR